MSRSNFVNTTIIGTMIKINPEMRYNKQMVAFVLIQLENTFIVCFDYFAIVVRHGDTQPEK